MPEKWLFVQGNPNLLRGLSANSSIWIPIMTSSKHDFEGSRKRELILFIKSLKQISDGSSKFIGSGALIGWKFCL